MCVCVRVRVCVCVCVCVCVRTQRKSLQIKIPETSMNMTCLFKCKEFSGWVLSLKGHQTEDTVKLA